MTNNNQDVPEYLQRAQHDYTLDIIAVICWIAFFAGIAAFLTVISH